MFEFEPTAMAKASHWLADNGFVLVVGFVAGSLCTIIGIAAKLYQLRRDGLI